MWKKILLTWKFIFKNLKWTMNSNARSVHSTLQKAICSTKTEGLLPKHWLERRYLWVNLGIGRSSRETSQAVFHFHKLEKLHRWMGWNTGEKKKKKSMGMEETTSQRKSAVDKEDYNFWWSQKLPVPLRWCALGYQVLEADSFCFYKIPTHLKSTLCYMLPTT